MKLNPLKVAITLVAMMIAGCGVILAVAAQQPPFVDIPPVLVLGVMVINAMLAVLQTQMPQWTQADSANDAMRHAARRGTDPRG